MYWRDKSVADSRHRSNEARASRIVVEGLSDIHDALNQGVVGDRGVFPDVFHQLGLADQMVMPLEQIDQDLKRFLCEVSFLPVLQQAAQRSVYDNVFKRIEAFLGVSHLTQSIALQRIRRFFAIPS